MILSFVLMFSLLLSVNTFYPLEVCAKTTAEKIKEAEAEKKQTEAQKKQTEAKKENLENTKEQLEGYLDELNDNLTQISENLSELEAKIAEKEREIEQTGSELVDAKAQESNQYELMKRRIKYMYEKGEDSYLERLLQAKSYSDFLNKAEYVEKVEEYDQNMLESLIVLKESIEEKERQLNSEMDDLQALQQDIANEKSKVATLVNSTSGSLASTAGQLVAAKTEEAAYEIELAKQEQELKELKKQLAEEQAMTQKAAGMSWRDISEVTFEAGDRDLLAAIIHCEAGAEPYSGQVAVGAVVINRMRSAAYPNSMVGVIYAPRQFSPVASGRLAARLAQGASSSCYAAADEAMSGSTPVGNCLYFRTVIPQIQGQVIGNHVFY